MKIYSTNAALSYGQEAYLIKLDKSQFGYNYLCIGFRGPDSPLHNYKIGEVVEDLEDFYVGIAAGFNIYDSPLYEIFLFKFFLENYKEN